MGARGRKSATSLAIIGPEGIETVRRPDSPDELTSEQAEEWRAVVNRLAADWFPREMHGLLAQYCRHIVAARRIAGLITNLWKSETIDLDDYDRLLKCQERESRCIASLATKMRITQQAFYDAKKKRGSPMPKPWETI